MKKKERNKTVKILNNIFQELNVNAKIKTTKQNEADSLSLIVDNFTSFDISGNTFQDIYNKIINISGEYDSYEKTMEWEKQNAEKSTLSKESEIREQFKNIRHELTIIYKVMWMLKECKTISDWEILDSNIKREKLVKLKNSIKNDRIVNSIDDILEDFKIDVLVYERSKWEDTEKDIIDLYPNVPNYYNFPQAFAPTSLIEVASEIKDFAKNYDWVKEKKLWKPGKNGVSKEPYLTEEFKDIGERMEDTRWAMEALLEIEKSQDKSYKNKERIIKKYKRIIHAINIFRKKCHILIPAFKNFGLNNDEILKLAKEEVG